MSRWLAAFRAVSNDTRCPKCPNPPEIHSSPSEPAPLLGFPAPLGADGAFPPISPVPPEIPSQQAAAVVLGDSGELRGTPAAALRTAPNPHVSWPEGISGGNGHFGLGMDIQTAACAEAERPAQPSDGPPWTDDREWIDRWRKAGLTLSDREPVLRAWLAAAPPPPLPRCLAGVELARIARNHAITVEIEP
jgi:hypothetical protein